MEHAYWGGMRDRIPNSQTSEMAPSGAPAMVRDGDRLRVKPQDNICLIRSGQDWSDTEASERKMYLDDVQPVLREGMDFLRDQGLSVGCFANRYTMVLDDNGRPTEKSYGMSWWKSLAALERVSIASDPRADFRRGDEISLDARPVGEASALSRSDGGAVMGRVL